MKPVPTIQPTPEQAQKIFDLFRDMDPDFTDGARETFMRDGQAFFDDVGSLKNEIIEGEIFIKGDQIGSWFKYTESYLTPIKGEDIFVRLDLDQRDDENIEAAIFVHKLEDIENVHKLLVHELLVAYMNQAATILGDHVAHDVAIERLRGAIAESTMGPAFMADDQARRLRDTIEAPAVAPKIRKQGL